MQSDRRLSAAKCFVGSDDCPIKVNSLSCITCRKFQEEKTVAVFDNRWKSDYSSFSKREPSKYQSVTRRIYMRRTVGNRNTSHSGIMSKKGSGNASHSGLMSKKGSGNASHSGLMSKKSSGNTSHSGLMSKGSIRDKILKSQNAMKKIALIKKKNKLSASEESDNEETDWNSPIKNIDFNDDTSNSDIKEMYSVHPYLSDEEQVKEERVVGSSSNEEMMVELLFENETVDLPSAKGKVVVSLPEEERAVNLPPRDELLTFKRKERLIDSLSEDRRFGSTQNTSKKRKVDVIYPPGPSCSSTVIKIPRRVESTQRPIRKWPTTSNGKSQKTVKAAPESPNSSSKSNVIYPPGPSCSSTVVKYLGHAKSTQSRAKSTPTLTRKIPSTSNGKSQKTVKTSNASSSSPTSKLPNIYSTAKSARIVSTEVKNLTEAVIRLEQELEQLKKTVNSNDKNSRTSYKKDMTPRVHNSRTGSEQRRPFVTEEDNSQLRTEIEKLTDKLSEAQDKLLNAKISEDRKKKKEDLMKEVESLEESCKNADKLRKLNCVKYHKQKVALEKEICGRLDPYTTEAKWLRSLIRSNRDKLRQFQPKLTPVPNTDRYKTPEHLLRHRKIESTIEEREEEAAPLKEEIAKSGGVLDKIDDVLLDQRKKVYILSEVLNALIKKFKYDVSSNDFSPESKEYDEYNEKVKEDIKNLEVAATAKAEQEYEAKVRRGASEQEFQNKYNPGNKFYDLRSTSASNRLLLAFLR